MWLTGTVSLDLWEIRSAQVRRPKTHVVPAAGRSGVRCHALSVSPVALAAAIARSSVTRAPDVLTGLWRFVSAFAALQAGVEERAGRLHARSGLTADLRDSTRTAWSGAVGQGLCWHAALTHFRNGQVIDFGAGCAKLLPPVPPPAPNDKRPDFMATADGFRSLSLFESKGMTATSRAAISWKADLRAALLQTAAGRARLKANGHGGAVTHEFATAFALLEQDPSFATYADPDNPESTPLPPESRHLLMREHYAAWAFAGGAIPLGERLREGDQLALDDLHQMDRYGRRFYILPPAGWPSFWRGGPILHAIDLGVADKMAGLQDADAIEVARAGYLHAVANYVPPAERDADVLLPDGTAYLLP